MPSGDIARQWFVVGEGIDRHVIVTDIQRYLGNDATVRPGKGTGENEGVQGYWIKAYRNLTTAMIADLRADSARWRQEQRMPGTRGSQSPRVLNQSGITVPDKVPDYVGSHTYHNSQAARAPRSRDGDSPAVEAPSFGSSVPSRPLQMDRMPDPRDPRMPPRMPQERIPVSREPVMPVDSRMQDRMDIDTPSAPPPDRRYQSVTNGYSDPRYGGPDPRGYSDPRPIYPQQEQSPYGRAPVTSSYSQESIYARSSNNPYPPQPNDGAPPGYVRQGNYFVPISSAEPAGRQDAPLYGHSNNYGQPPPPQRSDGRDLRDPRDGPRDPRDPRDQRDPRDPRYAQDYQDPRYAYPSPAATTASLPPTRERDSVTSPPQTSSYGSVPSYEYGSQRPGPQYPSTGQSGQPNQRSGAQPSSRDPSYGGQRPGPPPSNDSSRDARRKRQQ